MKYLVLTSLLLFYYSQFFPQGALDGSHTRAVVPQCLCQEGVKTIVKSSCELAHCANAKRREHHS